MPPQTHILGMSLSLYTQIHVAISVIGIASGLVVVRGMLAARILSAVTALFLATTLLIILGVFAVKRFHPAAPPVV
jgi:hypothetical protein